MEVLSPEALVTAALDPTRLYKHLLLPCSGQATVPRRHPPCPVMHAPQTRQVSPCWRLPSRDSARGTVRAGGWTAWGNQPEGVGRRGRWRRGPSWGGLIPQASTGLGSGLGSGSSLSARRKETSALAIAQSHPAKLAASYQKGEHSGASARH